jgi:hypothetical protein
MGPGSKTPERALLERIAAGDGDALAELARRHRRELLAAVRKAGDQGAEDALELALASAYVAIRGGARPAPVGPWLAAIARDALRPAPVPERSTSTAGEEDSDVGSLRRGVERARRRLAAVAALRPSPAAPRRAGIAAGVVVVATAVIAATLPDSPDRHRDGASAQAGDVVGISPPSKPASRSAPNENAEKRARPEAKRKDGSPRDRSAAPGRGSAAPASSSQSSGPSGASSAPAPGAEPTSTGSPGSTPSPAPTSPPASTAPPAPTAPTPTPSSPPPTPPASQPPPDPASPPQSCPPVSCAVDTVNDTVGGLMGR